ncbi:kinase A anchor protein [Lentinula guzmanii]|uniref:Kinase A anchor protein n=1 Tax=Lentinula guzmanii TaxID=2804957 RepID=A0AA38JH11_9AGAR|nr:kinase A anchor protein [Lentinula guzmanii]
MSIVTKSVTSNSSSNKRSQNRHRFGQPKSSEENRNDKGASKPPRPTHFLCLPLGHHPNLQEKMLRFHSSLLKDSIEGLDSSILVKPRRLHFTLGVMSLSSSSQNQSSDSRPSTSPPKTVESALGLLRSLQPQLTALCAAGKPGTLQGSLERVGAFESKDGARVLWVSPREDERWPESEEELQERLKLVRVAELVHRAFKDAGYITETRPLKLHCTLINTSYRKPFNRNSQLFSFTDVLASDAILELQPGEDHAQATSVTPSSVSPSNRTVRVAFGTYDIPEIQLCAMGSSGPDGEYISLGNARLTASGGGAAAV